MATAKSKRNEAAQAGLESQVEEAQPFFERRSVLASVFVIGLVTVIGVPLVFFAGGFSEDCNSGNSLIDSQCLAEKRRIKEEEEKKRNKFNIKPKKQPFKVTDKPLSALSQDE